jgi:LysR family transcriptional regulator for bpeEF and oprC
VYPQNRHLSPQVRVFVEWVAELFENCQLLRADNVLPSGIAQYVKHRQTSNAAGHVLESARAPGARSRDLVPM